MQQSHPLHPLILLFSPFTFHLIYLILTFFLQMYSYLLWFLSLVYYASRSPCSHVFPKSPQSLSVSPYPYTFVSPSTTPLHPSFYLSFGVAARLPDSRSPMLRYSRAKPEQRAHWVERRHNVGRLWQHQRWSHEVAKQLITTAPSSSCMHVCTVVKESKRNERLCLFHSRMTEYLQYATRVYISQRMWMDKKLLRA